VTAAHRLTRTVRGTVTHAGPARGRFLRLRIACPPLDWVPGRHVRVHPTGSLLGPRRTYSVWDHDGTALELRVFDHGGDGPGVRWARAARPGDAVLLGRPEGGPTLRPGAARHLFAGDETASVAFGPMLRALPPGSAVTVLLEAGDPADRLPLPGPVRWVGRGGLPGALAAAAAGPPGVAYLAGESRTVRALARALVHDHGWPRAAVLARPFRSARRPPAPGGPAR
jgi:NADPH-dependent ferric siderophore reductase